MATFTMAPVEEVVPARKPRGTSNREQTRQQYVEALQQAVTNGQALVVELEPEDKPLTVRNRLKRAVETLGVEDVIMRRRQNRIVVYINPGDQGDRRS